MKKLPSLALAALLAAVLPVCADTTLVQEVKQEADGQSKDMTIVTKIKGNLARMDIASQLSNIFDLTTGDTTSIAHQQKAVMKISAEKLKALQKEQGAQMPTMAPEPLKATGAKETINGFACEEYATKVGSDFQVSLWLTKDAQDAKLVLDNLNKVSNGLDPIATALLKLDVPGFPIRTVVTSPSGKVTSTVVSVKSEPIADADFVVPKDYKEIVLPPQP